MKTFKTFLSEDIFADIENIKRESAAQVYKHTDDPELHLQALQGTKADKLMLAENPHISNELKHRLASDPDWLIRHSIALRNDLPTLTRRAVHNDKNPLVRIASEESINSNNTKH